MILCPDFLGGKKNLEAVAVMEVLLRKTVICNL